LYLNSRLISTLLYHSLYIYIARGKYCVQYRIVSQDAENSKHKILPIAQKLRETADTQNAVR